MAASISSARGSDFPVMPASKDVSASFVRDIRVEEHCRSWSQTSTNPGVKREKEKENTQEEQQQVQGAA